MHINGMLLPADVKLINIKASAEKVIVDRDGCVALSMLLGENENRYFATIRLDGFPETRWYDTFGTGAQPDNVFNLGIERLSVSFAGSKRAIQREVVPGSIMITGIGLVLVGNPYNEGGERVYASLNSRERTGTSGDICHVLHGWTIYGFRGNSQIFEFRQPDDWLAPD